MNTNRLFYSSSSCESKKAKPVKCPPPPPPPPKKKKKIDIHQKKKNTIKSLNEVEFFLNDLKCFNRYVHLYKFFK